MFRFTGSVRELIGSRARTLLVASQCDVPPFVAALCCVPVSRHISYTFARALICQHAIAATPTALTSNYGNVKHSPLFEYNLRTYQQ